MSGLRFSDIHTRPTELLDLTSLTGEEFHCLVPAFERAFHTRMATWRLDGKPRTARRFSVDQACPLPTPEDRLLFVLTRADSAEGRRPSTGPEKRSAPRAGQRLGGAVAHRWRPLARSLRDRPRLLSGASELRVSGEQVFMTDPTLCYNTVGLSSRIGGWEGRKRASFLP
jgi:hypothetical protein